MRPASCSLPALYVQDEVRALGRLPELNVPEAFITRHPFPGEARLIWVRWVPCGATEINVTVKVL